MCGDLGLGFEIGDHADDVLGDQSAERAAGIDGVFDRSHTPAIASNFHFAIDDPSQRSRCDTRTDDPRTVGDLRETYGFVDVQPVDPQIVRLVEPNRAVAATSKIYSGLSSPRDNQGEN